MSIKNKIKKYSVESETNTDNSTRFAKKNPKVTSGLQSAKFAYGQFSESGVGGG